MTPEEIDALPKTTPAQMVAYFDSIIVSGLAGTSYSIRGRSESFAPLEGLLAARTYYYDLAQREAVAANDSPLGQVSYARFERPCPEPSRNVPFVRPCP